MNDACQYGASQKGARMVGWASIPITRLCCIVAAINALATDQYIMRSGQAITEADCGTPAPHWWDWSYIVLALPWLLIVAFQLAAMKKNATTTFDLVGGGMAALYAVLAAWIFNNDNWTCEFAGGTDGGFLNAVIWLFLAVPFSLYFVLKGWALHFSKAT
jgi:hypothetical protein